MAIKLGVNGFGRIGRYLVRLVEECPDLEIAAINARAENSDLAHLLKYDSVHGKFPGEVGYDEKGLIVNGKSIPVTRKPIGEWEWGDYGVDIAVIRIERANLQHLLPSPSKRRSRADCLRLPAEGPARSVHRG